MPEPVEPVAPVAPVTAVPTPPPAPVAPVEPPAAPAAAESVDALPEWAQRIIHDTRAEAATHRNTAKTAAEQAQKDLTDKLAVALGLKPDAATDPAALTASLTEAQSKAAQSARELAIFKAASAAGADPVRLLDSNAFMSSIGGLDPSDGAAVTAAIQAAVAANPLLKVVRAAAASGTELGGTGETGQLTEEQFQLIKNDPEAIVAAQKAGKLRNILGG